MTKLMTVLTGIILLSSTYAFGGENGCPGQFAPIGVQEAIDLRDSLGRTHPVDSHIISRDKNGDGLICLKITNEKQGGLRFRYNNSKTK